MARLSDISDFTAESRIYEFPDESGLGDPYLNKVIAVVSIYNYDDFRDRLKAIERELGRTERSKSTGIMPVDLDIIMCDKKIVDKYQFTREYFRIGYADLRKCE